MGVCSWLRVGAISGFLAVALGAFGAHGLRDRFKVLEGDSSETRTMKVRAIENFETAARYQMYHAMAMVAVGLLGLARGSGSGGALSVAGWSFLVGTVVFSGSLYAWALTGEKWLVMLTPLGGGSFLVGWGALTVAAWKPAACTPQSANRV
jgi:uncharacterized membrane protein YgdD (TMEM256/DUF423 family)